MPEHLRALVVVLGLAVFTWWLIQPSILQMASPSVARQWRNLWFVTTISAFAVGNFWAYALLVTLLVLSQRLDPLHALAAYLMLLLAVPGASLAVPGFGLVNYFFTLNQPRLLALIVLAPAALALSRRGGTPSFGRTAPDKLLLGYLVLVGMLQLRETNLTNTLRGCFNLLIDVWLPYYVASRAVRSTSDLRLVMTALCAALALLGMLSLFEMLRHWNLYAAMTHALGIEWGYSGYLGRDGVLRASGSTGQPIVLGYVMMIGLTMQLYLREGERRPVRSLAPALLITGGLLAALSRGPWVGMVAAVLAYIWTGRQATRQTLRLGVGGIVALGMAMVFGFGQKILSYLPFIGTVDIENVTYRQRLIDNGLIVIGKNFWLGSTDYLQTPEMQSMIQGQGIIDLVNTYLGVALDYGVIGLALFASLFAVTTWQLWRTQTKLPWGDERRMVGRCLLAILVGIMVTIATVSSIVVIPILYWLIIGLSVGWLNMNSPTRSRQIS